MRKLTIFFENVLVSEYIDFTHLLITLIGLNPCLERNYMANKHDEETKNLIMGSVKDKPMPGSGRPVTTATMATSLLPPPSAVGRRSPNQPIPFLQNNIHTASSPRRKNTNVNVEKADRMAGLNLTQ